MHLLHPKIQMRDERETEKMWGVMIEQVLDVARYDEQT